MKQDLPQLVDERRFRRREQDTVERDEFGRVRVNLAVCIHLTSTDKSLAQMARRKDPHYP